MLIKERFLLEKASKSNLHSLKTHNAIKASIKEMICVMDAPDLCVSDIAANIGINRKTFYLHYSCIEELLEEISDDICAGYRNALDELTDNEFSDGMYSAFFDFFTRQNNYVEQIICNGSYYRYFNRICHGCGQVNRSRKNILDYLDEEEQELFQDYAVRNEFNLYRQWVKTEKKIPVDHLASFSYQLIFKGLQSVVETDE